MKFLRIQWFKKILGAAERSASRFLFFGSIGVLFFGLLWMIAHPYFGVRYDYRLGEISQENVVTPRDITYVNEKETAKRIQEMKERVPPIFEMRIAAGKQIGTMNQFFSRLQTTSAEQLLAESEGQDGAVSLSLEKLQFLADSEKTAEYRLVMESLVDALSEKGYTRMEREELDNFTGTGMIVEKIRESEITEETIQPEEVIAGGELETAATSYLKRNHPQLDESERRALASAAPLFISPNLFYDEEESRQYLAEQIKKVEPVYNTLKKGAIVIRTGEEINETSFRKLEAISQHTSYFNLQAVLGISIILGILLTLSLIIFLEEQDRKSANNYLVFAMFILVSVAYAYLMNLIRNVPDYLVFGVFIPAAGITMTAELLYKRKFSLTLALVLPILFMLISGNDAYTFLFTLGSGLIGIFTVRNAEKRGDLLRSSLVLVITNCLILGAAGLLRELAPRQFVMLLVWGAGNGVVSVILTLGVTPFFEIILNLPTNFRLLELSDLNTPVLKKMQIEAPGTYHHSLNVANMAENAARAIKANSLLVRVAALYHDVGKIPNSEYFIENSGGESKHDSLKPSLSNSILKAHVKMGVEMSRQMKLPDEVVDIIAQHHGTSLMKYFYNQALEKYDNGDIDKKDYHYPGPKPQNREAAIVLLADNVEAASRVLKKPSPTRIEEFVNEVVESKFREGQLNESTLTLRGLMKISIAFRRYLMGVFHTRIQYPDDRELEGKEQDKKQKEVKK